MENYQSFFKRIDKDYRKMKEFDKQTLFSNIYYLWCIHHFFSMHVIWKLTALRRLERNIKRKWMDDLPNVNLLLEKMRERDQQIKPTSFFFLLFFFENESYLEHLLLWKIVKEDELLQARHIIKLKRHKKNFCMAIKKNN